MPRFPLPQGEGQGEGIAGKPGIRARAAVALLLLLAGCQFGELRRNLAVLDENGYLRGRLELADGAPAGTLVVFAVPAEGTDKTAADWAVLAQPGRYFLVVPVGEYRIGAFEDSNDSLAFDPGERVGWVHGGRPVTVRPGSTTAGLNLHLRADGEAAPIAVTLPVRDAETVDALPASRLGELVTIDDPRFSEASARVGLWRPVEFLTDIGAGIYFLEPYDPARTPVLFVHGALGHPDNFRVLVDRLDRRRFQAWLAYYPSAIRLEVVAAALDRWLEALEVEYGFERLGLVAHSMGGLVARAYVADDADRLGEELESLAFVTIATPWQGHPSAALGVARAPVAVPAWFDLAPGSPFLTRLFDKPLPPHAAFELFFAYGGSSRLGGPATDGVITLASQLPLRAQREARRVIGFDAGHRAVLDDPAVADELQRSLELVAPPP